MGARKFRALFRRDQATLSQMKNRRTDEPVAARPGFGLPLKRLRCHNLYRFKSALNFHFEEPFMTWQCHYCRLPLSLEVQDRNHMCPGCGSDIHSCKNCLHYDENLSSKCKEPHSPWVRDRSAQNSCEIFEFKKTNSPTHAPQASESTSEADRAKEAFRALFRNA